MVLALLELFAMSAGESRISLAIQIKVQGAYGSATLLMADSNLRIVNSRNVLVLKRATFHLLQFLSRI